MTNSRPTTPSRILTAAGHRQIYHVATGPNPREAAAALVKPEPQLLAPAQADDEFDPITGLNADGWTRDGWHNGHRYDLNGRDRDGYAEFHKPWDDQGFTPAGYTLEGYGRDGNHRDTGTPFGPDGRDRHGFWPDGSVQREGAPTVRLHNTDGFLADGTHRVTGTQWDERGFDWDLNHRAQETSSTIAASAGSAKHETGRAVTPMIVITTAWIAPAGTSREPTMRRAPR